VAAAVARGKIRFGGTSMAQRSTDVVRHAVPQSADRNSETVLGLLRRLSRELSTLFRQELALASAEISRSLTTLLVSLVSVVSGGAVLYAGFLVLLVAGVCGLAYVLPLWLAALTVGIAVVLIGCVLVVMGRNKLKSADLLPTRSPQSLRRDKDVITRSGS
jgi:Putative Actinobacterial Holin-X, holin superfamily III